MSIIGKAAWGGIASGVGLGLLAAWGLLKLGETEHLVTFAVCGFMTGGPLLGEAVRASRRADQPLDRSILAIGILMGVVILALCISIVMTLLR